jgi:hypothetical protein
MFERSHAEGIIIIGDIEGGDPALDILAAQHRSVVGVTDRTTRRQILGVSADSWRWTTSGSSDTTAIGLMQAASQAGITIPDRLSMVGYDDIDMAPYTIPPLTTISQTGVEMGRVATELLFRMIDQNLNREEVSDVVLAPMLVVRQSTAPHRPGSRGLAVSRARHGDPALEEEHRLVGSCRPVVKRATGAAGEQEVAEIWQS